MVNAAMNFLPSNLHSDAATSDQNFRLGLNKYDTKPDSANDKVSAAFQLSTDPANFVLDVLQGSYEKEVRGFTARVLLEKLINVSPKISPQVKEQARKLALVWMSTVELEMQNSDYVLAFLLLVAVYELAPWFRVEELLRLAEAVTQQKQAPEICRALGFAYKIPGKLLTIQSAIQVT